MILKIKTNSDDGTVLINDKDFTINRQETMNKDLRTLMRGQNQIYCEAAVSGSSIRFLYKVNDQTW